MERVRRMLVSAPCGIRLRTQPASRKRQPVERTSRGSDASTTSTRNVPVSNHCAAGGGSGGVLRQPESSRIPRSPAILNMHEINRFPVTFPRSGIFPSPFRYFPVI